MKIEVDLPDGLNGFDTRKFMQLEKIKIDEYVMEIPHLAAYLIQQKYEQVLDLRRTIEKNFDVLPERFEMMRLIDRMLKGEKIDKVKHLKKDFFEKAAMESLKADWELEVKHGMTGWIQKNWPKLGAIQCDCGNLISYDVLFYGKSTELICNDCYEKSK